MNDAGQYTRKLQWQKRVITKNATNGQDVENWFDNGKLWCRVEYLQGTEERAYGATQPGTLVEIRIRNYPAISAMDRLHSGQWGELYILDTVRRGDNEWICEAHLFEALEL